MPETPETPAWPSVDASGPTRPPRPTCTCTATTKAGTPCQSAPLHGGQYCYVHSPDISAEERHANAVKGGENRRRRGFGPPSKIKLPTPEMLAATIVDALAKTRTGVMRPATAEAIVRMASAAIKALDAVETSRRLAAIEARLDEMQGAMK